MESTMEVYAGKGDTTQKDDIVRIDYQHVEPIKLKLSFDNICVDDYILEKCNYLIPEILKEYSEYSCEDLLKYGNKPNHDFRDISRVLSPVGIYNQMLKDITVTCCLFGNFERALAFCIVINYLGTDDTSRENIDSFIFGNCENLIVPLYSVKVELLYKSFIHTYRFNTILLRFIKIFSKDNITF